VEETPGEWDPVAGYQQRRLMPKATHQVEPAPHHGLGVERYAPISRACSRCTDLLTHQQIVGFLDAGKPPLDTENLKQALLYTSSARAAAREIENSARRYWLLRHLEEQVGQDADAVVIERSGNRCVVELSETRLMGLCSLGSHVGIQPGMRVRARILRASARADALRMAIAGP
jgi:exoribonuclease-2